MLTQPAFFAEMSADGFVGTSIPHCRGVLSTARTDDPNSADTQFFLMREHSPHLDKMYTSWGRVIAGQDVVKALKNARDVSNIGHWGTGDVEITLTSMKEFEEIKPLLAA